MNNAEKPPVDSVDPDRTKPLDFEAVFDEELEVIHRRRRRGTKCSEDASADDCKDNLFGLALSGGGIRSAMFNLGVLQALARYRLLGRIDYLSVNSGGGYIGGWLAAWIKRAGLNNVQRRLGHHAGVRTERSQTGGVEPEADDKQEDAAYQSTGFVRRVAHAAIKSVREFRQRRAADAIGLDDEWPTRTIEPEPYPISHLRRYTNYLTPRVGLFSIDTWVLVATYLRNFLLNLAVIGLASTSLIYFVRFAVIFFGTTPAGPESQFVLAVAGLLLLLIALTTFGFLTRPKLVPVDPKEHPGARDSKFVASTKAYFFDSPQGFLVLPTFIACLLIAKLNKDSVEKILAQNSIDLGLGTNHPHAVLAVYFLAVWLILSILIFWRHLRSPALPDKAGMTDKVVVRIKTTALILVIAATTTVVSITSMHYAFDFLDYALPLTDDALSMTRKFRVVFSAPVIVVAIFIINISFIGLAGRLLTEQQRQWWSRLGAWLLIYSLAWILLSCIVHVLPELMGKETLGGFSVSTILLIVWPVLSAAGAYSGHRLEAYQEAASVARRIFMKAAPLIFIIGLLAFNASVMPTTDVAASMEIIQFFQLSQYLTANPAMGSFMFGLVLIGLTFALSTRVDVNQFSMHNFYRARLVRAFLGAYGARDADSFTDFSRDDDIPLTDLAYQNSDSATNKYDGPIPIYNCALNLVASDRLALQERKADSFTFTPYHFGYRFRPQAPSEVDYMDTSIFVSVAEPAYRRTEDFGSEISVGLAMALSGAAISPNMGYRSTSTLAFLLTVFNVRLGAWIINPRTKGASRRLTPRYGFASLFSELFAQTNEDTDYVYLSDGGHFENLAVYELVRRKCRYIIATDAAADPKFAFLDLGNLIRKCRTDFSVNIEIDMSEIRPGENGLSRNQFAVGRIRYDQAYPGEQPGFLVYIKSSLTGQETVDIAAYRSKHPTFPHQSTADQWFTESQFDSYRALGYQIGDAMLKNCGEKDAPLETLFSHLRRAAFPASARIRKNFTNHANRLQDLLADLSRDSKLEFLDRQLFPDSHRIGRSETEPYESVPDDPDKFRQGFYFCNRLLQLMENVFIDLSFERESDHPDNRGWVNLFNYWASSDMLRLTWSLSASTYGARFQKFCSDELELRMPDLSCHDTDILSLSTDAIASIDPGLSGITSKERRRLEMLIRCREGCDTDAHMRTFWTFSIEIQMGLFPDDARKNTYPLPCGFAIIDDQDRLVYMRIRDHLRGLGLARRALVALRDEGKMPLVMAPEARELYEEIARDPDRGRYFELLLYSLASSERTNSRR